MRLDGSWRNQVCQARRMSAECAAPQAHCGLMELRWHLTYYLFAPTSRLFPRRGHSCSPAPWLSSRLLPSQPASHQVFGTRPVKAALRTAW